MNFNARETTGRIWREKDIKPSLSRIARIPAKPTARFLIDVEDLRRNAVSRRESESDPHMVFAISPVEGGIYLGIAFDALAVLFVQY